MKMIPLLIFALLIASCGGCVYSKSVPMGEARFSARDPNYAVKVYLPAYAPVILIEAAGSPNLINVTQSTTSDELKSQLPEGVKLIGRVDVSGAPYSSWKSNFAEAKKKARELGGDSIFVGDWSNPLVGFDTYGTANYGKTLSVLVLRSN